jgi:hypothetical protein
MSPNDGKPSLNHHDNRRHCESSGEKENAVIARSEATRQSRKHRVTLDCFAPLAVTAFSFSAGRPMAGLERAMA